MANGKTKGNAFERRICKELSLWWTDQINDSVFWRTSNSGGRATVRAKQKKKTAQEYGDVTYIDPIGKPLIDALTIELKIGYTSSTIADIADAPATAKKQIYAEWFRKAERDHLEAGSFSWVLIAQRTRRMPMIYMRASVLDKLFRHGAATPLITMSVEDDPSEEDCVCGTHLANFYRCVKPSQIVAMAKKK